MTNEQRHRLTALLPGMLTVARRAPTQNEFQRRFNQIEELKRFLKLEDMGITEVGFPNGEEWLAIAEKAAEGHDKPGVIKGMTMEQIRSGKPPEFFIQKEA